MDTKILKNIAVISLMVLLTAGCSSNSSALSPDLRPVSQQDRLRLESSNRILWGFYQVSIDRRDLSVDISPLRTAEFNGNVMRFLHPPYTPIHLMKILILPGSIPLEGYIEAEITFSHPFPGLNKFRGFDVRGIFMADGSHQSQHDPSLIYSDSSKNEAILINADGYTRWWNSTEFTDPMPLLSYKPGKLGNLPYPTATLNPYKYFADDLAKDADVSSLDVSTRGVFNPDTSGNTRIYKIKFPVINDKPYFKFNYAVDASWHEPDKAYEPEYPLESFSSSAQCQEAYHLSVNSKGTTAWYEAGEFGGSVNLTIEVFDWQGRFNSLGVPGEVKAIYVESPVFTNPVDIFPIANISQGATETSSVFQVELSPSYLSISSAGDFPVLLCVESAFPETYQPQFEGGESFIFPDAPLSAYTFGTIHVNDKKPWNKAENVVGDVKLSVARQDEGSIIGIILDWSENTNISPYYAVYADNNPYDVLLPDMFISEFTQSVVMIDITVMPVFSSNGAYAFGVKGRTISGSVDSESPDMSQLAFVELEDFDGGPAPIAWSEGYRSATYQWVEANPGKIDGSTSMRHPPETPIDYWSVIAGEPLPAIPDSGTSFIEFMHIGSFYSWLAYYKDFSAGWTHSIPPIGPATYFDYDSTTDFYCIMDGTWGWIMPAGPPPTGGLIGLVERFDWNPGYTFFGWRFSDVPQGPAALTRMSMPEYIKDAGSIRPAFAWATCVHNNYQDWMELDETAVVIY